MSKYICLTVAALLVFIAGCDEYEYTIEMTPQAETLKRTINFSSNLPDEQKRAVEESYPEQIDANTFSGAFKVELPNDVGGAGYYTYFVTNMGSTATYKERFRGDDDLNQHIVDFQMFVDRYVDFTINWLEFELGKEPNFGNLRAFLDKKLRIDAKNFGLYSGFGDVVGRYDSNATDEFHQRVVLYLEERGYINPGQSDILMQMGGSGGEEEVMKLLRDIVAGEIGCCREGEDSGKLAFLDSNDSIEKSIIRYIRSTERYRQMWEKEKISKKDANLPPPDVDILAFIAEGAPIPFDFNFGSIPYKVNVRLNCPYKPFKTNGQWQDANNQVCWTDYLKDKDDLPTFFYATWSEPNNDFQSRHFGRVILEGKNLAEYCYWEKSIEAGQVRQWNEFLSGIDPNMEIGTMVKAFRFPGESAEPNAPSLADVPRSFILDALSQK
jgi:hypothetical protein